MKIDFNPAAAVHAPNARGPQAQSTPTPPAPEVTDDGVEIILSQAAQQALKAGGTEYTGSSPAHMARQYIANNLAAASAEGGEGPNLSGPFGQIVKTFAPGHNKTTADAEGSDAVPEDGGDTATGEVAEGGDDTTVVETPEDTDGTGTTDATDGADITVVAAPDETDTSGETDPTLVVDEPDVTEVLDDTTPAEGEVSEPESDLAGSGDAVASAGDGETTDQGTTVGSSEPVAIVDGGDLTDELLDLFDEGSAETV